MIVPARNEAHNIDTCVRSILASRWPSLEVIVIDDRSEDDTGAIVRAIAAADARLRVVEGTPVPEGWFGKQWACAQGARIARGSTLVFTDADTTHAPTLVPRSMQAMRARALDFLTVAGFQELGSFWERVVMPQVFYMIATRYGGAGAVNRARRTRDKIANGQYMCFTRACYDAIGGHESVRGKAAEDLALAQLVQARGMRGELVLGERELSTRMYTSLARGGERVDEEHGHGRGGHAAADSRNVVGAAGALAHRAAHAPATSAHADRVALRSGVQRYRALGGGVLRRAARLVGVHLCACIPALAVVRAHAPARRGNRDLHRRAGDGARSQCRLEGAALPGGLTSFSHEAI